MDNDKDELPLITYTELLNSAKTANPADFKALLTTHKFEIDSVDEKGKPLIFTHRPDYYL